MQTTSWPRAFIWRRLHSLSGVFLALYIAEHLFVNSQAALLVANADSGFVAAVDAIQKLPFLPFLEMGLLGMPILLHLILGIRYLHTSASNVYGGDGSVPSLGEYSANWRYTLQRITSWIVLIALVGHIVQMRFIHYPLHSEAMGVHPISYAVRISEDRYLQPLAERLGISLYGEAAVDALESAYPQIAAQVSGKPLKDNELVAVANSFGKIELLVVRDTFKQPIMVVLYTLFVLAACYHAFNGLWTAMIRWGVTLTVRSQRYMLFFCSALMILVAFFGLASIFGSYWLNFHSYKDL
jgi:succinate dehydrogenase / fumarate reductase cytochrome b subunit